MRAIDVVVPNYQYGRYLGHCITSVLRQDIDRLRLLIIDNASTDDSLEVAQQLARSDPRVQVVAHSSNLGHHASFNEGIDWASSDYFMLLCADDLLVPGCLSRAVAFMEAHPDVHLTFGRAARIQSDDFVPDVPAFQEASWHVMPGAELVEVVCRAGGRYSIDSSTVVVRTSAQKRVGRYRAELPFMDDLEMWLRFACLGRVASTSAVQEVSQNSPGDENRVPIGPTFRRSRLGPPARGRLRELLCKRGRFPTRSKASTHGSSSKPCGTCLLGCPSEPPSR